MGKDLEESLTNPIQSKHNSIRVDLCPKSFYPDEEHAKSIKITDITPIHIESDVVLPYIDVMRPKSE